MTTFSIVYIVIITILVIVLSYTTYNMMKKNEQMEEFIESQSEFIKIMDNKLQEVDIRGSFRSDDEIGWFFNSIKEMQKALNEFRLD